MPDGKGLPSPIDPAERVIEAFADAKLDGSLRDAGMFVIGFVVLLSTALPGVPHYVLLWVGSVMVTYFGAIMALRSARSFFEGREK